MADYNFMGNGFSQHRLSNPPECSDFSGNGDHSVSICFDDVFINESELKSTSISICNDLVPTLIVDFESRYNTAIWQPPKFA